MKHIINKYLLVTLIAAMPYLAYADVPDTISFQGYLSDDSGNAVNGTTDITFSIVDTSWKEKHYDVPVNNGIFSVQLGSETAFGNSVDFSKVPKWLEMKFKNGSSQRVQFSTVPYAFHAKTVEQGLDILAQCRICLYYADLNGNASRRMICINLKNGADSGLMHFAGAVDGNDVLKMTFRCDNGPTGAWADWSH